MLKKTYRISKAKDFQRIKASGKSFFSGHIGLRCARVNSNCARFGFIVSTKVSKKAIVRNRIRRQLSEIVRENIDQIKPGTDCIIMVRSGIKDYDFVEIKRRMEDIFNKANILKR